MNPKTSVLEKKHDITAGSMATKKPPTKNRRRKRIHKKQHHPNSEIVDLTAKEDSNEVRPNESILGDDSSSD